MDSVARYERIAHTLLRPLGAQYYVSQCQHFSGLRGGPGLSGRVAPYQLGGSRYQPRWGTTDDGDLMVPGVHAL